jgi:tetratricopeptide (TPR) repeat protein
VRREQPPQDFRPLRVSSVYDSGSDDDSLRTRRCERGTGIGDIHKFAGRFDEAKPLHEKAIALEPANENPELDYAEYFLELARKDDAAEGEKGGDSPSGRGGLIPRAACPREIRSDPRTLESTCP